MAQTLLGFVNDVLTRTGMVQGDSGTLSTLTDSARQTDINRAVQITNEVVMTLYSFSSFPKEVAEGTITLSDGTRAYSLPSDFEQMHGESYRERVLKNASNNFFMYEYKVRNGALSPYAQMYHDQLDFSDYKGQPLHWALSPLADEIYVDMTPGAEQAGDAYTFLYDKDIRLSVAADTFPFSDSVADTLISVVAYLWGLSSKERSAESIASVTGFQTALEMVTRRKTERRYGPYR